MAVNRVVFGGSTVIDLSEATLRGTDDAGNIVSGVTCYARDGSLVTGTMPNIGTQIGIISTKDQEVNISAGYHNNLGSVSIDTTERNKIINSNIKSGVTILGVSGKVTVIDTETSEQETAASAYEVLSGYTAFVNGVKITGNIPNGLIGYNANTTNVFVGEGYYADDVTVPVPIITQNNSTKVLSIT